MHERKAHAVSYLYHYQITQKNGFIIYDKSSVQTNCQGNHKISK